MALAERARLCELATLDSDWIGVWPRGDLSGHRVCATLREEVLGQHAELLKGRHLTGLHPRVLAALEAAGRA